MVGGWVYKWVDRQMDRQFGGSMDEWMGGQMDGWTNGYQEASATFFTQKILARSDDPPKVGRVDEERGHESRADWNQVSGSDMWSMNRT